ncbi:hypothetical protein COO60DRAFT_653512 [Scenedesmus sp. NREL 46B-D3]|nr:hypothetical protein COO60DRAFT_653512 [Scenedesmus sp. NREL 46B-D3]
MLPTAQAAAAVMRSFILLLGQLLVLLPMLLLTLQLPCPVRVFTVCQLLLQLLHIALRSCSVCTRFLQSLHQRSSACCLRLKLCHKRSTVTCCCCSSCPPSARHRVPTSCYTPMHQLCLQDSELLPEARCLFLCSQLLLFASAAFCCATRSCAARSSRESARRLRSASAFARDSSATERPARSSASSDSRIRRACDNTSVAGRGVSGLVRPTTWLCWTQPH